MKTVEVIVEHAGKNLSAYIEGAPVITVGNDMKEIEDLHQGCFEPDYRNQ